MSSSISDHSQRTATTQTQPAARARRLTVHSVFGLIHPFSRRLRMRRFEKMLTPTPRTRILDVGGTEYNWRFVSAHPTIVLLNIAPPLAEDDRRFTHVVGDARQLAYDDATFAIAFSNSVIEHVGDFEDQRRFAEEIRRVGRQIWVQTPARESPFEPHYLTFFVHWLPAKWRRRLVRYGSLWGWIQRPSQAEVAAMVQEIRLLDRKEMEQLFPDCEILTERFLFIPRSHIAVRR